MSEFPPLTPEQQDQLDQLIHQQALADWQAAEDARLARLAVFTPLEGAIDLQLVLDRISAVELASGDFDTKTRIHRLRTVLSTDMRWLLDELARAQTPAPMPVEESEPAPE